MKRIFASVPALLILISADPALAQSPEAAPVIAADIHASKPGTTELTSALLAGGITIHGATIFELISIAYQVEDNQIVGGPPWLNTDRFDIAAKAAATSQQDTILPMLQALLADRFKLAIRKEERPLPVFALTVGKRGLKLKESPGDGSSHCVSGGGGVATRTEACQHMTMAELVQRLPAMANAYLDHPVVDQTGLTGAYDFNLSWTPRGQLKKLTGDTDQPSVTIFDAVDMQLGLKLEAQQKPGTVIIVEHVERTPTENPAGVTRKLPPAPTEFEVAEIRVSKPGTKEGEPRFLQSGRLELPGTTLKRLITLAYEVEEDMVVNAPKWWDSDHFDLVAKTPNLVPFETLRTMLQKLIEERFKLVVHKDVQPVTVYAFTAGKRNVKLRESDGSSRSDCKNGTEDGARTISCQNTTIEQLTVKLRNAAAGYLDHPLIDLTGLKGSYDFTMKWAPKNRFTNAGRGGGDGSQPAGGVGAAADPNGDITVFEAVEKYLGLRLAAQKHPMPVIVVDKVDRTPTEN